MDANEVIQQEQEYIPANSQLERARKIRRFNWFAVYLPVSLISLIGLLALILMIYLALVKPGEETLQTVSGFADAIAILGMIPLTLLCAVVPALLIIATIQARRKNRAPIRQFQKLMWRLESRIQAFDEPVNRLTTRIANPIITIQARSAFLGTIIRRLRGFFR
jgi:hypothetical protein